MTVTELQNQLRALQGLRTGGSPDPAWQENARRVLMSEARSDAARAAKPAHAWFAASEWARLLFPWNALRLAARPAIASLAAVGVVLGGWVTTVSASYGALPGDRLYGMKIAAERAQATFVVDRGDRAKLHMEFVGRRVDEVAKLVEASAPAKAENVAAAVNQLKEEIATVQEQLDDLKNSKPSEVVEIAQMVDRKAGEFETILKKTVANVPAEAQTAVKEATNLVADASVKAVAVLVETRAQGSVEITADVVKEKVQEKIESAPTSTPAAKEAIGAAQQLLEENDFSGALSKLAEGTALSREAELPLIGTAATGTDIITLPLIGQELLPDRNVSSTPR